MLRNEGITCQTATLPVPIIVDDDHDRGPSCVICPAWKDVVV